VSGRGARRSLPSFPTRRSSDLLVASGNFAWLNWLTMLLAFAAVSDDVLRAVLPGLPVTPPSASGPGWFAVVVGAVTLLVLALSRSEEHTSELQSRENLVCRLLL